jgi:hypothetical protein
VWFDISPLVMHNNFDWTLMKEAIVFVETSVHIYLTTRRHIPEDAYLHIHRSDLVLHYVINLGHYVNRQLLFGHSVYKNLLFGYSVYR